MQSSPLSKILVIADTPTENTGFACVVRNTIKHWHSHFERIDIWGINYNGWPHEYPYRIFPAGADWKALKNLMRLLNHINGSDYTHLWVLQDTFLLSQSQLPQYLSEICRRKKIRLVTYFPVDAPMENEWLDIVRVSDAAATYTPYGAEEANRFARAEGKMPLPAIEIIPHGVDTDAFRPLDKTSRWRWRNELFPEWANKKILVNVNRNDRRKALVNSLQLLLRLRSEYDQDYRLYLHCLAKNDHDGVNLFQAAESLGLEHGIDWLTPHESNFPRGVGLFTEQQLNQIYNAADVCITTTLGEGWGLSITEAASAGLPVVAPHHTSIPYIESIINGPGQTRVKTALCSEIAVLHPMDNSRVRFPVDIDRMARAVHEHSAFFGEERTPLREEAIKILSWENIAKRWLELLQP